MAYILLIGLALLLLILLLSNLGRANSHFLMLVVKWTAFLILVAGISILLFTGRVALAGGALLLFALFFGPQLKTWVKKIFRVREALPSKMDEKEAREVLGIPEKATKKEILEAYRRLISRNHPDHGGSSYMAAKLNEAREVLLKEKAEKKEKVKKEED